MGNTAGNAIAVVKDWLGHADVNTTHGYVEINREMKRKALEACQAPKSQTMPRRRWQDPDLLKRLDELTTAPRRMAARGLHLPVGTTVTALTQVAQNLRSCKISISAQLQFGSA